MSPGPVVVELTGGRNKRGTLDCLRRLATGGRRDRFAEGLEMVRKGSGVVQDDQQAGELKGKSGDLELVGKKFQGFRDSGGGGFN